MKFLFDIFDLNNIPNPCGEELSFGESEDYTVNIIYSQGTSWYLYGLNSFGFPIHSRITLSLLLIIACLNISKSIWYLSEDCLLSFSRYWWVYYWVESLQWWKEMSQFTRVIQMPGPRNWRRSTRLWNRFRLQFQLASMRR